MHVICHLDVGKDVHIVVQVRIIVDVLRNGYGTLGLRRWIEQAAYIATKLAAPFLCLWTRIDDDRGRFKKAGEKTLKENRLSGKPSPK